jgi:hypothetical protein
MITWTCKGPAAAIVALSLLAGCEEGQGAAFLDGLNLPAATTGPTTAPVTEAQMMGKGFTLVAPKGYCIDPKNLTARFAIMARCDVLGQSNTSRGAPLGIITASISPAQPGISVPTPDQSARAMGLSDVHNRTQHSKSVVFRATGTAPTQDVADQQWRGTALIGGYLIGLAVYGPKNGAAVSGEGGALLSALITGTRARNAK